MTHAPGTAKKSDLAIIRFIGLADPADASAARIML
jgi:hypothetical protein